MELLLHYIWQHRLYQSLTPQGAIQSIQVLDPGVHNEDAGPDFLNAKIIIDGLLWAGSVEIHHSSGEWTQHRHDRDPAYQNLILHIVEVDNQPQYDQHGHPLPTCVMSVPEELRQQEELILGHRDFLPCTLQEQQISPKIIRDWLERLGTERLLQKGFDLSNYRQGAGGSWAEAFYIALFRGFGFGINSEAMERLARSLPLRYIHRQRSNPKQIEALLIGQANLLDQLPDHPYAHELRHEYQFLRAKYNLTPLPEGSFRRGCIRPQTMPLLRLLQLSNILCQREFISDQCLQFASIQELSTLFRLPLREVWDCLPTQGKQLSTTSCQSLLINVVCPYLSIYGIEQNKPELSNRALQILRALPPEDNRHTRGFEQSGFCLRNAFESQAVIHLSKNYCERRKCIFCAWGKRLLSSPSQVLRTPQKDEVTPSKEG